jgi:hypothetical protein
MARLTDFHRQQPPCPATAPLRRKQCLSCCLEANPPAVDLLIVGVPPSSAPVSTPPSSPPSPLSIPHLNRTLNAPSTGEQRHQGRRRPCCTFATCPEEGDEVMTVLHLDPWRTL